MIKVKSIETQKYEVVMYQTNKGFNIFYSNYIMGDKTSENILDFSTASFLFEVKLQEMEGQ